MKIINLQQNTPDWEKWRAEGIGASDAVIVVTGRNSYGKTVEMLRDEKWGGKKSFVTEKMRKGHEYEPVGRAQACRDFLCEFVPLCAEHDEYKWLRASFDCIDIQNREIVELKYVNEKTFQFFKEMEDHEDWFYQVQTQLAVSGYDSAHIRAVSNETGESHTVCLLRDEVVISEIISSGMAFMSSKIDYLAPTSVDIPVIQDNSIESILDRLSLISIEKKVLEDECSALKANLTDKGYVSSFRCGNYLAKWNPGKETVDYKSIPALKGMDLSGFKKVGDGYWTVKSV